MTLATGPCWRAHSFVRPLFDISIGGICAISYLPVSDDIQGKKDSGLELLLPMVRPIRIPSVVRWRKKRKLHETLSFGECSYTEYHVGFEFLKLAPADLDAIKLYIAKLVNLKSI